MEPKPDHNRQDILCLGQTIGGSVLPRDNQEIGNVNLPHSGGDRKRRDRPDSARLAQSGVVPGPIRSHDSSNSSLTSAETAQADLLTPLSSTSVESQPSRLQVIKGFYKERGFSEAVAQRLAISRRQSSAGVYESGRCESGAMLSKLILSRQLSNS